MTTTHARTANEQRIAALECRVVTMRGVLERLGSGQVIADGCPTMLPPKGHDIVADELRDRMDFARDALSDSANYANKVVVDMEEWGELLALEVANRIFARIPDDDEHEDEINEIGREFAVALARLDSLRKADEATAAVHIAERDKT